MSPFGFSQVTTDYTQYNKLRNGEATPDVAEVEKTPSLSIVSLL